MSKKNYLLIDNGHGPTIKDITTLQVPLCSAILIALNDEKALMKWLHEKHNYEPWRVYALIETDEKKGSVKALFGHSLSKNLKNLIQNELNIKNCDLSFEGGDLIYD